MREAGVSRATRRPHRGAARDAHGRVTLAARSTLEASTTCAIPRAMRFLLAGAVLIVLGLSLTEYTRRSAQPTTTTTTEAAEDTAPTKKKLPPKLATLLELGTPDLAEPVAPADASLALLGTLKTDGAPIGGLTPLLTGDFTVRQLRAGFGYAIAAVDVGDGSALLRVEPGTPTKVLATRARRITALTLDASTLFFAEGGRVYTLSARGDGLMPRAVFPNATVTSLAAFGDDLLLAVTPPGQPDTSTEGVVVRLDAAGELTVLPRALYSTFNGRPIRRFPLGMIFTSFASFGDC